MSFITYSQSQCTLDESDSGVAGGRVCVCVYFGRNAHDTTAISCNVVENIWSSFHSNFCFSEADESDFLPRPLPVPSEFVHFDYMPYFVVAISVATGRFYR